ncbi:MAG: polysaccharide biosynthesis C-terminal domain-containing protein, partial [Clostridia bacterium]|nr:polysaccharide biosynthesis C-terminal domain-containing protein [Clostridia bacterium]
LFIPCTLVGSLALALMPEISGAKNKNSKQIAVSIQNALIFAIMVSLAIMGIYITVGKDITIFLFHSERAGELLIYSAAIMIPMSLSHMSSSILNSLGREYKSLKNYIAGAAVMLIFVWFLPEFLGIYAMIFGFFFSYLITATLNIIAIKKDISNVKIFSKSLPLLLLIGCASALTCYIVNSFSKRFLPLIISLGISCALSAAVFLLLSAMFKICFTDTILGKFMPKCLTKQKK